MQMVLVAKQQAEMTANTAAEAALKKAEAMKRRITPPAKPGTFLRHFAFFISISLPIW